MPKPVTSRSSLGWTNQGNYFPFVAPVNSEVSGIHCDDAVFGVYLAHSDKTQVGQIRLPILVRLCEGTKLRKVIVTIERESKELFSHHLQHKANVA